MLVDAGRYSSGLRIDDSGTAEFEWIGLVDPTSDEVRALEKKFGFHPLSTKDALAGCTRPKFSSRHDHEVLMLRTITYDDVSSRIATGDIIVMYSRDYIVTVRHGESVPLHSVRTDLEEHPDRLRAGASAVVHEILDRLLEQYVRVCRHLTVDVAEIEDQIFTGDTPHQDARIYLVKRELIEFRRSVRPLLEPLESLAAGQSAFLDDDYHIHFSDLLNRLRRIIDEVDGMNELMTSAIAANLALVQIRQNVDMRRISAWVGIGAVPTTIAGVYGMNFANMPELTWRYGYYAVITGLVGVSAGLFLLFRKYRWL